MKIQDVTELGLLGTLIVYVIFFVCSPNGSLNSKDRAGTGGTLGPVSGRLIYQHL